MGNVESLRKTISREEFDYRVLLDALQDYAQPRKKINDLLAKGVIVRVKKGLYVFGDEYRNKPYSREILANLIYGPSCVSLEYALHHYGLIPERVEAVTSVTTKRPKEFRTPIGSFLYRNIPDAGFHVGLQRIELNDGRAYLMASPEKALADKFRSDRGLHIRTRKACLDYLANSLRIEPGDLANLDVKLLEKIAAAYGSRRIHLLADLVKYLKKGTG